MFKTINIKVLKTVRNQVKHPKILWLPMLLLKGVKTCTFSIFYAAKKNNKKITNKSSIKTYQKTLSKPLSHILALMICSIVTSSNTDNVVCGFLLIRLGSR